MRARAFRRSCRLFAASQLLALTVAGCGDDSAAGDDDDDDDDEVIDAAPDAPADALVDAPDDPLMPMTLEASGLWSDFAGEVLADGVYRYEVSYALWSDGAAKRRWIYLPPGEQIDTSDMDYWVYPVGTKLWKEFRRDGVRIETRFLFKTAEDTWYRIAYGWNAEGTATAAVPSAGADDVFGTPHDVPSRNDCNKCHVRMPDRVIGFTAILLDHPLDGVDDAEMNLDRLVGEGWLSAPPVAGGGGSYFPVPGDEVTRRTLGYVHANCGGCHHARSDVFDALDMTLKLEAASLAEPGVTPQDTTIWQTTVGVENQLDLSGVTARVEPGAPGASAMFVRMNQRGGQTMPPLGTEDVDVPAVADLEAWILSLPP